MLNQTTLSGLTGLLLLVSGTAAGASDKQPESKDTKQPETKETAATSESGSGEQSGGQTRIERVVVSLPSGRRYVIEREVKEDERPSSSPGRTTRTLNDGTRINYGLKGSTGSTSKNRSRTSGQSSSAGRGAAVTGSRGGSASTASRSGSGGGGSAASSGGGGASGKGAARPGSTGGGGMNLGTVPGAGVKSPPAQSAPAQTVPTIGNPRYSDEGATGGQDVAFHDAGISAMVFGRTVYIWGAELVQSSEQFQLVEGERFAFDGAVARLEKQVSSGQTLTSSEFLQAPLKLEYAPGDTVTLTMFSKAQNPEQPDRQIRNWTFRVR